ncbi:RloB family protein [Microbispora triticiradicis]|uniref:RloB family protein n=1 Tax=Microbispora TaxID=2005 RepID=UPI00142EFA24|nr:MULTISPECIES: RloB family protein [Microbispora]
MLYAVVEGEATERDYLEYLEERYAGDPRTFEIQVIWERNGLKPREVIDRAAEKLEELDDPKREQVWAFFDRDQHNQIEECHTRALAGGINLVFSHPSFDLWLLLHFVPGPPGAQGGSSSRIQQQLAAAHPAYRDFGKRDKRIAGARRQALDGRANHAVKLAKALVANCPSVGCSVSRGHVAHCKVLDRDPSTDAWKLLESLGIAPETTAERS